MKYDPEELHVWPWQQHKRNWSTFVADSGCLTALEVKVNAQTRENRKDEDKASQRCLKPHVLQELILLNPSPVLTLPFLSFISKTKSNTIQRPAASLRKQRVRKSRQNERFSVLPEDRRSAHEGLARRPFLLSACRSACRCMFWGFGSVSIHAESLALQTSSVLRGVKAARDTQGFSHFHKEQPRRKKHHKPGWKSFT